MMKREREDTTPRFVTSLAATRAEVRAAQRLRYEVFADELGARLPDAGGRLDQDRFDTWCDHLLVRVGRDGPVVGTYRMLPAAVARRLGGFYSEIEFDLGRVRELPNLVELGRACVHPDHRQGAVVALLWAGLASYLHANRAEHVIGCGSIPLADDPRRAGGVCRRLVRDHLAAEEWRVTPRVRFPWAEVEPAPPDAIPPLIRGYLRLGASVCGEPAWDADFGTADLLILLPVARMHARYARRFSRAA